MSNRKNSDKFIEIMKEVGKYVSYQDIKKMRKMDERIDMHNKL